MTYELEIKYFYRCDNKECNAESPRFSETEKDSDLWWEQLGWKMLLNTYPTPNFMLCNQCLKRYASLSIEGFAKQYLRAT